jgi:hypothetical protein
MAEEGTTEKYFAQRRWGHVFGRRTAKTRRDLVRAEFGESMDHFRRAATRAAGGLGAAVGPRMGAAKDRTWSARGYITPAATRVGTVTSRSWDQTIAALAPLAESARQGSARAAMLEMKNGKRGKNGKNGKNGNGDKGQGMSRLGFTTMSEEVEQTSHTGMYALLATGAVLGAAGALVARRRTRAKWAEYEPSSLSADASSFKDAGATSKSLGDRMKSATGMTDDPSGSSVGKAANSIKGQTKSAVDTLRSKISGKSTNDDGMSDNAEMMKDKANDGASHMADKGEAKMNDASSRTGGSPSGNAKDMAAGAQKRTSDEVDDLIRSTKNGRM